METGEDFISNIDGKFKVHRNIQGQEINFGTFNTLDEAIKVRDDLDDKSWPIKLDKSESNSNIISENIEKIDDKFLVFKIFNSEKKIFGKYDSLKEAQTAKHNLMSNGWESDKYFSRAKYGKYISKSGNKFLVHKSISGEEYKFGLYKSLKDAINHRDQLVADNWAEYDDIDSEKFGKYIHYINNKYYVQKIINGKIRNYGSYDTLEEAKKQRTDLISKDWKGYKPKTNKTDPKMKYIHYISNKYYIQKIINGKIKNFDSSENLEEIMILRDKLVINNWGNLRNEEELEDFIEIDSNYFIIEREVYDKIPTLKELTQDDYKPEENNNKTLIYGIFNTQKEAISERDKLIDNSWHGLYTIKTENWKYGKHIIPLGKTFNIKKNIEDKEYLATYSNFIDAVKARNLLINNNWNLNILDPENSYNNTIKESLNADTKDSINKSITKNENKNDITENFKPQFIINRNIIINQNNSSATGVLTPDPNIYIDEVGIPKIISKILTVKIIIDENNILLAKDLILNNSLNVKCVISSDNKIIKINDENKNEIAENIKPGVIIKRNLIDGDNVIVYNPKFDSISSLMVYKAKILPIPTFRINPSLYNLNKYELNEDIVNLYVLNIENSCTEIESLSKVQDHILAPQFGGPIIGAKHDHISGAYLLTREGSTFTEEQAFQIIRKSHIPIPKRKFEDWTGKEIFSLLLPNDLNINYKAKICRNCNTCLTTSCENNAYVFIENGILKNGAIDENGIGPFNGKILDKILKDYGQKYAINFLNKLTILVLSGLMKAGITSSIHDEKIPIEAEEIIEKYLTQTEEKICDLVENYEQRKLKPIFGRSLEETLEIKIMQIIDEAQKKFREIEKDYLNMKNYSAIMARTGAIGPAYNLTPINICIGQQFVRGSRVDKGYIERILPHFRRNEMSAKSKGFIYSSYKEGLSPTEFFFHAIEGRDEAINKFVNTIRSNYIQRNLVNGLQDLKVKENGLVKDNQSKVIQAIYGEDGINPTKSDYGKIADLDELINKIRYKK